MKLLFFIAILSSQAALAKVSVKNTRPVHLPTAPSNAWTSEDVGKIIPTDMGNSTDAGHVALKIGDRTLQSVLNSPNIKNSSVGRTATKVQDTMKTEMIVKSGSNKSAVDHKFSFQVLALQAISKFNYSGWLNAELNFDARAQQTNFEISEKVWNDKDFVISHSANHRQDLSSVGLRWNW